MNKDARRVSLLVFSASLFVAALPAAAQTWTGAGPDNNWSTGANWSGGVAPASAPTTQLTFPNGAPRTTPVVDAPWTVNRMTFSNHTVSGQAITFDGVAAGISALSAAPVLNNPIVLATPIIVDGDSSLLTLNGPISGPGSVTVRAATTLTGMSSFTGGVVVSGGSLRVDGSIAGPVAVGPSGVLEGAGTISGPVVADGALLSLRNQLKTGDLTLAARSEVLMTIKGPAPNQYGTAAVTGAVSIAGCTLTLFGTYAPAAGDVFTVIANDGADPVVGTFFNLPEGATFTFNGVPMRISYVGGTGNDVTVTAIAPDTDTHQVPTLSEWGIIIMTMLVIGIGMFKSRRR